MNDILSDIKKMREELFHLIDPVILKNQDMLAFDSWFCSHPAINIQKQEDEIIFINTSDQPHYISLIEKNTYFNSLPKTVIEVFPNETIAGEMNFIFDNRGKVMSKSRKNKINQVFIQRAIQTYDFPSNQFTSNCDKNKWKRNCYFNKW